MYMDTGSMCEIQKEIMSQLCGELPSVESVIALRYICRYVNICTPVTGYNCIKFEGRKIIKIVIIAVDN